MTIELNRQDSPYTFRVNPYAQTEIDFRKNQHGARWLFHSRHATPQEALARLLELEKDEAK